MTLWLEMLNCPYENASLNFCLLKCCADMSQRPDERPDRFRLGRQQNSTSSAQGETSNTPSFGWSREGARDFIG